MASQTLPEKVPTPDTTPASTDLLYKVNDPYGTPVDDATTIANAVTKAHGLSDGARVVVSGGVLSSNNTDLPVADGGTGASDASGARTNLGLVIGADVQAYDADLAALAGLSGVEGDIIYRDATQWQRLPKGTANQLLRVNAGETAPEWATISSSGQTLYDAIVASSGGDYTTLGAAITAASDGWRIFVKDGTYSETTITTSLANLVIEGESCNKAILSHSSTTLTFSGANVTIRNIGFSGTTGKLVLSGDEFCLDNTRHSYSTSNDNITFSGNKGCGSRVWITNTSTTNDVASVIHCTGARNRYANIYIYANARTQSANKATFFNSGTSMNLTNLTIQSLGSTRADGQIFANSGSNSSIKGLIVTDGTSSTNVAIVQNLSGGTGTVYTGCTIHQCVVTMAGGAVFSGNTIIPGTTTGTIVLYALGTGVVLTDNRLIGTSTSSQVGIDIQGNDNVIVKGNSVTNFPTGLQGTSNADDYLIAGNDFTGCTTPITGLTSYNGQISPDNINIRPTDVSIVVQATNTSGGALAAGDVVILKAVASGNEVTTTTTQGDDNVYGVAMAAISNNAVGRIKTLGKVVTLKVNGTTDIAIGDLLGTYTSAGIAMKASAGDMVFAKALEAYTGDDSNGVIDAVLFSPRLI